MAQQQSSSTGLPDADVAARVLQAQGLAAKIAHLEDLRVLTESPDLWRATLEAFERFLPHCPATMRPTTTQEALEVLSLFHAVRSHSTAPARTAHPSARKRPAYCVTRTRGARSSRRRQPGAFRGSRRVAASRGDPDDGDSDPAGLAAPAGGAARSHETCPHCGRVLLWAWVYGKPALVCVRRGCGQP